MPVGHPPLLDTNDRAKAHDPAFQAAQVAARDAAEAEAPETVQDAPAEAPEDDEDDAEPDPVTVKSRRGKHEAADG